MALSAKHLHHLTITTGHSRRYHRHEVAPHVLAGLRQLLRDALPPGRDTGRIELDMIEPAGHWLRLTRYGRCLLATLMHADDMPLVTFGVATHSRCGATMWRHLVDGATLAAEALERPPDPRRAPQKPWCAARLEAGIAYMPDSAEWAGDLERCLAWAWMDMIEEQRA